MVMKKIAKGLLIVWLLGAVGMTFYYAHERRSACIRDEGFWKGWLWCSSDPKSTFAISIQHAVDLVNGLAWPIKIFMREDGRAQAAGGPSWEVRGNEAAIILESKSNSGEAQFTILVIK